MGSDGPLSPVMTPLSPAGNPAVSATNYLSQLMKDKKTLQAYPNTFIHLERVLDEEISRVRRSVSHLGTNTEPLTLPEPLGPTVSLTEKLVIPSKEYPDFNFVGRLLGPRGLTAKQLELDTGCKILIRGQGSLRDKKKEEQMKGKAKWEHLNEELHVLIHVEDSKNRAQLKLKRAVDEIKKLLIPAGEGEDELKKRQLMELALLNGTYKGFGNIFFSDIVPPGSPAMFGLPMMFRSPDHTGAPIILPPSIPVFTGPMTPLPSPLIMNGAMHPPPPLMSPGDHPTAFIYQIEPCLISSPNTPPMLEYPMSPPPNFGRHAHPLAHIAIPYSH